MACYDYDNPPLLGDYLASCLFPNIWMFIRVILFAAAVILTIILVYKTIMNRENPKMLPEIWKNWFYLIILFLVVIGGAGTILNMVFGLLKLPDIQYWLDVLNDFFKYL